MASQSGVIFDIQRGALHDGPGIRTTVFFQGCPLRCLWCHNPESWALPATADSAGTSLLSVADVMAVVTRDRAFYIRSGGGLTASGGEPTLQSEFLIALFSSAKAEGIATCLVTCGAFSKRLAATLLQLTDVFLFDFKASPDCNHHTLTAVYRPPILARLDQLLDAGARVILRCPLIPGVNDGDEHLSEIARLSKKVEKTELMPYHATGAYKYQRVGIPYALSDLPTTSQEITNQWCAQISSFGGKNVVAG